MHAERAIVFDICRRYGAAPVLVWCRCDDFVETQRRLAARRRREAEPEHEASDVSVYHHIVGRSDDPLEDAVAIDVVVYDTDAETARCVGRATARIAVIDRALRRPCCRD